LLLLAASFPVAGGAFTMVTGGGAGLLIPATVVGLGGFGLTGGGATGLTK